MKIYFSGGFRSGWQDEIIKLDLGILEGCDFIDPRSHKLTEPDQYTCIDLASIDQSDVVLAYLEPSNSNPYGLCVEVGYARALSKTIVLVDKCTSISGFGMVRGCATVIVGSFHEAAHFLGALRQMTRS